MIEEIKHWFGFGLEPPTTPVEVEQAQDPLLVLAITLTKRQDEHWPDRDGECKRAAVYQQLTNTFPDRNKREVSRAIEDALCGD